MSSDDAAPPIGHNLPPAGEEEGDPLIEQVAIDLWLSRDDRSWQEAGEHWRQIFRELATAAVKSVRRYEREHG